MVEILFCDTAYSQCLKNFYGFANLLYISQTGESSEEDLEFSLFNLIYFYLKLKKYFYVLGSKLILFFFFKWSYSQRCFNVAQRCET